MDSIIRYAILSLGTGAIYALIAQGIVAIYRGSGVLNFAQGALAMFAAYLYNDLHVKPPAGDHRGFFDGPYGWPPIPSFIVAVMATMGIGLLFYVLVVRRLRDAAPLAKVIATLGLMITLQAIVVLRWGSESKPAIAALPISSVKVLGTEVGADRLILLGLAAALTLALWWFYRSTTVGLATSAVAENEVAAATLGWSPDRIAGANWMFGSALAAGSGILIAATQGPLGPTQLMLLVVPALACALIGGFQSFPLTFVGAIFIALIEIETRVQLSQRFSAVRGLEKAVPLAVIIVVLVIRGNSIPVRGTVSEKKPALGSGRVKWKTVAIAFVVVELLIFFPWDVDLKIVKLPLADVWINAVIVNAGIAIVLLSVVVIVGYTGQLSLGQFAMAGMGALIAGRLVATQHWPFALALVVGIVGAVPLGILFALPATRTRGPALAVITLSLAVAVEALFFQRAYYSPPEAGAVKTDTGLNKILPIGSGTREGTIVGKTRIFGIDINNLDHPDRYATFAVVCFVLCALVVANLRRSRAGRRLIAVRTNERAAAALGINVAATKVYAFALSAGLAAFGGIVLAFRFESITYGSGAYDPFKSILLVAFAVIGGVGYIMGSVLGGQFWPGGLASAIGKWVSTGFRKLGGALRWIVAGLFAVIGVRMARQQHARRTARDEPVPGLMATMIGGAIIMGLIGLLLGNKIAGWLQHPDVYLPLIGGIVVMAVLLQGNGDGMAAHAGHALSRKPKTGVKAAVAAGIERIERTHGRVEPRILEVRGLTVRFGPVTAVNDVSFTVEPGQVVGLIGPNGAGKTTIIDAISGYNKPATGSVSIDGEPIDGLPAHRRAKAGISRSFQNLELFEDLSVLDNIRAAADERDFMAYFSGLVAPRNRPLTSTALAAIDEFNLVDDLDRKVNELPYGRRGLVAIARAMASRPSILLLDEPAAGLDESQSRELALLVRRLADEWGLGVLLIEHDMAFVMGISDRIVVLDFGSKIAEGDAATVQANPQVRAAYLGEDDEVAIDDEVINDLEIRTAAP